MILLSKSFFPGVDIFRRRTKILPRFGCTHYENMPKTSCIHFLLTVAALSIMLDYSRYYQGHFRLGPWHLAWALGLGPSWSAGGHIVMGGPSISIPRGHSLVLMTGVVTALLLIVSGRRQRRQLQCEENATNPGNNNEGSKL